MATSRVLRILQAALAAGLIACPVAQVEGGVSHWPASADKPPVFQGGEWYDDLWTPEWISAMERMELNTSHLQLKFDESLHWTQTWTAHFAGGEFYHTQAVSDSVRLAPDGGGQYHTTGAYTSTVHDAGRAVDWSASAWNYQGTPEGLTVEYQTGGTPVPDSNWTSWASPSQGIFEYTCAYITDLERAECRTNLLGIPSSRYIQYRATFASSDPAKTMVLDDIDLVYGTHVLTGSAKSVLVTPGDLWRWDQVTISSTVPAGTHLVIDVLGAGGAVLLHNAGNGDSLAGIDRREHPAIQLSATFTSTDTSLTPDVDRWGLRWVVAQKAYLPVVWR